MNEWLHQLLYNLIKMSTHWSVDFYIHWPHRQFKERANTVYTNPALRERVLLLIGRHQPNTACQDATHVHRHQKAWGSKLFKPHVGTGSHNEVTSFYPLTLPDTNWTDPQTKDWCHWSTRSRIPASGNLNKQGQPVESSVIVVCNQRKSKCSMKEDLMLIRQFAVIYPINFTVYYTNISQQMCVTGEA